MNYSVMLASGGNDYLLREIQSKSHDSHMTNHMNIITDLVEK